MRLGGKQLGPALTNLGSTLGGLTTQLEGRRKKKALQDFTEKLVGIIKDPAFNPTPQQIIEMAQAEGLTNPQELQVCFALVSEFKKAGASYQAGQPIPGAVGSPTWEEAGQFGKTFGQEVAGRQYGFGKPKVPPKLYETTKGWQPREAAIGLGKPTLTPQQKGYEDVVQRITAQGGQPIQAPGLPGRIATPQDSLLAGLSQRGRLRNIPSAGEGRPGGTFAMPPAAPGYGWVGTEQKALPKPVKKKAPTMKKMQNLEGKLTWHRYDPDSDTLVDTGKIAEKAPEEKGRLTENAVLENIRELVDYDEAKTSKWYGRYRKLYGENKDREAAFNQVMEELGKPAAPTKTDQDDVDFRYLWR